MHEAICELEHDFSVLAKRIDFKSYDPLSKDFLSAAIIGLMAMVMGEVAGDVEEEMASAEKYLGMYERTGDGAFKEMAMDELRHAEKLIKVHLASASDDEETDRLNRLEAERQNMSKMVSSATLPIKNVLAS